jgi:hypothetical protein
MVDLDAAFHDLGQRALFRQMIFRLQQRAVFIARSLLVGFR